MTKFTKRLAVAAVLVASAQSAMALSISNPFKITSSFLDGLTEKSAPGDLRFTKRKPDAEDTFPAMHRSTDTATQAASSTFSAGMGSVIVGGAQAAPSAEGITAAPPTPAAELVAALAVPVTSVAAVVSADKVESPAEDTRIATTPLPAGGLLLLFAGMALVASRRLRMP